tara:strand:+ start:21 stop:260 length:240 start_codon:yes stop_codon:yes gene_type:complete
MAYDTQPMNEPNNVSLAITIAVLNERLESIEEKLDSIVLANTEKHTDLEMRVRMVERWMYAVPASIVTAIVSVAVALIN